MEPTTTIRFHIGYDEDKDYANILSIGPEWGSQFSLRAETDFEVSVCIFVQCFEFSDYVVQGFRARGRESSGWFSGWILVLGFKQIE